MTDHLHHHHHHQHRPHRLSVPPRSGTPSSLSAVVNKTPYPLYPPYSSSTPTPTPSKTRLKSSSNKTSFSLFFLLLFSLRSFYSILPFLRSSPSFSLFPFSFLVSLLSFLLSLSFSFFSSSSSSKYPFHLSNKQNQPIFSLSSVSQFQLKILFAKSILLAVVFLLRFQALRYCGTAAMILAEFSGNVAARFVAEGRSQNLGDLNRGRYSSVFGFLALFSGLLLLSVSWDRIECFPSVTSFVENWGLSVFPRKNCLRIWPMLLPFLSGFLGCYERVSMNWGTIRQMGRKQVRLISLFFTTVLLLIPALVSLIVFEDKEDNFSVGNFIWPLANTVVFGVLLSENYSDDKLVSSKDFRSEFFVTFVCTLVLEMLYFPQLSLRGLLLCGLLLYIAVRELDPIYLNYLQLGLESSESFSSLIMKPVRHILSERKSRKIALFLLINTAYMVVEFVAGFMSNSLGLISDACHMLFDCAALAIGLYASYISRLPANSQFNYGRGRFEVLSGYINAVFLVLVGALIVLESLERILDPQEISTNSLLSVSIGGLVVNMVGLVFFHEEHHHAHGGSGSCSHSHSHSHQHSGHPVEHDHHDHGKHHDVISVSQECHDMPYSDHSGNHKHNSCTHVNHAHSHDHQYVHQDQHDHVHNHGHCDRAHSLDSRGHDHGHQHVHQDHHAHKHDHHDNSPQCTNRHDHGHQHDMNDHHSHENKHNNEGVASSSSRSLSDTEAPKKHHHRHIDHNMEGIFLHVLADTMGSVGVVISTLLIKYKGWLVADPACSIFISVLIISSVIPLLRNSAEILLQRVPRAHEQEVKAAMNDITKIRGVSDIQNLHVWSFTNTDVVGTLQLHVSTETDKASIKAKVTHILQDAGVKDLTLQVESVG